MQLATSDDHAGLRAALVAVLPAVIWQRCQVHLQSNATAYVPKTEMRAGIASDIRSIFTAPARLEAGRLLKMVSDKYRESAPRLFRSGWSRASQKA